MTVERAGRAWRPAGSSAAEEFSAALGPHLGRLGRLIAAQAPRALIEDVRQDTLLRAYRSWHRFDPEQPLWPWLARIAERACATAWRADARWRRGDAESVISSDETPGSEQHVSALHARSVVAATLADLTPRERVLLYRCDAEGAPRQVLAANIALTPGAVRVALHRARNRFRQVARDRWDDLGVAAGVVVTRLRGRLRHGEPQVQAWAVPAAVFVTAVATVVVHFSPPSHTVRAAGPPPGAASVSTDTAKSAPAQARNDVSSTTPGLPEPDRKRPSAVGGREASRDPSSAPLPHPSARVDVGKDGVYGGVRVEFVTPDGAGDFWANPEVRCRHSVVTKAVCGVTGVAPSAGPVEFYGSGDGDS